MPPDVAFLARVFPVLQGVEAVAAARRDAPEMPDQQELRRRAFAGLRELLKRLGGEGPLVLAIDDLQWGDVDSAILLSDLLCSPQSPVLLFVGSFRSEDAEDSPFLAELRRSIAGRPARLEHRELAVEALTQAEARELTLALLGRDDAVARAQAHVVARESGGNPLFIDELVKHIQGGEPIDRWEAIGQLDLDEVLWERIQRQPEDGAAAAGRRRGLGPADPPGAGLPGRRAGGRRPRGAGLAPDRAADPLIGQAQQDEIEIYHDRIRETVVAHLPPDRLRWHHERLALVLSAAGPGRPGGPGRPLSRAPAMRPGRASTTPAGPTRRRRRWRSTTPRGSTGPRSSSTRGRRSRPVALRRKLGDALANAGRGAEAAQAYLNAAGSADAAETLELKRLASTQLLISGHVDEGLALLRTLLDAAGHRACPRRPAAPWRRCCGTGRCSGSAGLRFRPRRRRPRSRRWT